MFENKLFKFEKREKYLTRFTISIFSISISKFKKQNNSSNKKFHEEINVNFNKKIKRQIEKIRRTRISISRLSLFFFKNINDDKKKQLI